MDSPRLQPVADRAYDSAERSTARACLNPTCSAERYDRPVVSAAFRERLQHVYWIGGGSGGGKSTIARHIADRHGLRVYSTDDVMADHARRSTRDDPPLLHSFMDMDMDARWMSRPPATMLDHSSLPGRQVGPIRSDRTTFHPGAPSFRPFTSAIPSPTGFGNNQHRKRGVHDV
jgi:hypothetical protein